METLAPNDFQNLNKSIQQLYTLHNLDTFGVDTLAIVDRLVPSDYPIFNLTDASTGKLYQTFLPNYPCLSPELISVLENVLSQERDSHPIAQNMPQTFNGAYKLSDFINQPELHAREGLYQQFLKPLYVEDQMMLFLPDVHAQTWKEFVRSHTILTSFIINRYERSFTERDRLILNLFRPHLFQAYTTAQKYQESQQHCSQLQQSLDYLGTIVLDPEGRVKSIASQTVTWLETYFGKAKCNQQLPDHLWAWVKHQIASFTHHIDIPSTFLPLRIQHGGRELAIRLTIEPGGERYLLLLSEQTLSSLNYLRILELSQRETEVLTLLMKGKNDKEIAIQLSVKTGTVRKHLSSIYQKLGVKNRTEAITTALKKLGVLESFSLS